MTQVIGFPAPQKKHARQCITIDEQFDNGELLGDALVLNMDAVRHLRSAIPLESERVCSALYLGDSETQLIANVAIALINALEDQMNRKPEE